MRRTHVCRLGRADTHQKRTKLVKYTENCLTWRGPTVQQKKDTFPLNEQKKIRSDELTKKTHVLFPCAVSVKEGGSEKKKCSKSLF